MCGTARAPGPFTRYEEAMMSTNGQTAAGVTVPDTKLAREATELVRESATDLVYHHSRRVFWFGSLQGRNRGLSFDPELLSRAEYRADKHRYRGVMTGTATAALTELIRPH